MDQEHHSDASRLADTEYKARQNGMAGSWAPAACTGRDGTAGGVAVWAPVRVHASNPIGRRDPVLHLGRAVAALAHRCVPCDITFVSACLDVGLKLAGESIDVLPTATSYLDKLNAAGRPWVTGGDWNLDVDSGIDDWFH